MQTAALLFKVSSINYLIWSRTYGSLLQPYNTVATQITGHEQPLALGEPAAINCSSDLEVERIEWLNSDNEVVTCNSGEQQLTLNIERVNHGENNAVFTCRIMTSRPNGTATQNITLSVNGRVYHTSKCVII